jgi:hypothetical protein
MKWPGMVELTRIDGTVRSQEVSSGGDGVAGSEAFGGPGAWSAQGGPLHHRIPTVPFKHHAEHRHHIPKPRYRVTNWREYDAALRLRDSLTVWFTDEAIAAWRAEPRTTPGGQPYYSALAIATALTMPAVFRLALRQTEGLIGSVNSAARARTHGAGSLHDVPPRQGVGFASASPVHNRSASPPHGQHRP